MRSVPRKLFVEDIRLSNARSFSNPTESVTRCSLWHSLDMREVSSKILYRGTIDVRGALP